MRTDWVCFLDSDDLWWPELLTTLWPRTPDRVLVSGAALLFVSGQLLTVLGTSYPRGQELVSPAELLVPANPVVASATLVRTRVVRDVGGFDAKLRYTEDLDLWLRLIERGHGWCDPRPVLTYHRGEGSKSQQSHGDVERARAYIASRYEGRPWWTPGVRERYLGGMYWEGARLALRSQNRRSALLCLGRAFAHPARVRGVAESLDRNRRLRARATAFKRSSERRVALDG